MRARRWLPPRSPTPGARRFRRPRGAQPDQPAAQPHHPAARHHHPGAQPDHPAAPPHPSAAQPHHPAPPPPAPPPHAARSRYAIVPGRRPTRPRPAKGPGPLRRLWRRHRWWLTHQHLWLPLIVGGIGITFALSARVLGDDEIERSLATAFSNRYGVAARTVDCERIGGGRIRCTVLPERPVRGFDGPIEVKGAIDSHAVMNDKQGDPLIYSEDGVVWRFPRPAGGAGSP